VGKNRLKSSDMFRHRLRKARKGRGWTQAYLAKRVSLHFTEISHLERGSRKPSFNNLIKVADALGVTTDYLVGNPILDADDLIYEDIKKLTGEDRILLARFTKFLIG